MAHRVGDRVKESTSTIGTGAFTTTGALVGFRALSTLLTANGDTATYAAVNGAEWETGVITRVSSTSYSRSVEESSNADAPVSFSSGPTLYTTITARVFRNQREVLTAARTYYVRTDGSDSNDGLANTAGGAFLTLQKASTVIERNLDLAGQAVTVQVGNGTYTAGVTLPNFTGGGTVSFIGNTATPSSVVVSPTSANCFTASGARQFTVNGFKMQTTTSGYGVSALSAGIIALSNFEFGACASGHMLANVGGRIFVGTNYTVSGGAPVHVEFTEGGVVQSSSRTVTITGTPNFSVGWCYGRGPSSYLVNSCTFSGSATGPRYNLNNGASAYVAGAASNYLPGDSAGSVTAGGIYG